MEPTILKSQRNEYGRRIRSDYENHLVKEKWAAMKEIVPRTDGLSNTLTTFAKDNILLIEGRERYLTPRECLRLQGFPDDAISRMLQIPVNRTNKHITYALIGNSIAVPCLYAIFKALFIEEGGQL